MKHKVKSNLIDKIFDNFSLFLNIAIAFFIISISIELIGLFVKFPDWIDKILPVAVRTIFFIVLLSTSILLGVSLKYFFAFSILFISSKIRMPYYHWVENSFPLWLTVFVILIFGISMILIGFPKKNNRKFNSIVFIIFFMSSIFVVPCFNIGPPINSLILFLSFILFCILALKHSRKKSREKKSKTSTV